MIINFCFPPHGLAACHRHGESQHWVYSGLMFSKECNKKTQEQKVEVTERKSRNDGLWNPNWTGVGEWMDIADQAACLAKVC